MISKLFNSRNKTPTGLVLSHVHYVSDTSAADNFQNIVTNEEISQNEQFLHLPQYSQLYLIIIIPFTMMLNIFA